MRKDAPPEKYVVFCIPTLKKPYQCTLDSLEASVPLLDAAGWKHSMVSEVGSPYISCARSIMLRKALDAKAQVIVFIDHDLSWEPQDLLTLIEAEGDVVSGNYRYKYEPEEYMGIPLPDLEGNPQVRTDGGVKGYYIPAGFLKITRRGVARFIDAYPELCYGDKCAPHIDLFNHGAFQNVWYGEDYSFSRRWRDLGGEIIILPNLNISHHTTEQEFKGNFHEYLMRQPGGSNDPERVNGD
jgi:glycosyltransferase involved in cell wall biosynthesis